MVSGGTSNGGTALNNNSIGSININTLTSGDSGYISGGGAGGNVAASFDASQTLGTVSIISGGGGNSVAINAVGGNGGNSSLNTNGHTLDVTNLILQSRTDGAGIHGGDGGNADLDAGNGTINIGNSLTMESNSSPNTAMIQNVGLLKFTGSTATVDLKETTGSLFLFAKKTDFSDVTTATINANRVSPGAIMFGETWLAKNTNIHMENKASTLNYMRDNANASWIFNNYINFLLPSDIANGDTMLTVTNGANMSNSTVGILSGSSSLTSLQPNDQITLISGSLTGTIANNGEQVIATYGATTHAFDISSDTMGVYANLRKRQVGALSKAYLEPSSGKLAQQNMAYDSILGQLNNLSTTRGTHSFSTVEGYGMRVNSGSHVDATGTNISVGGYIKEALLTYGAFLETGLGSYDSYNSFASVGKVKGSGNTNYYGVGTFGKYDLPNNFYVDASARLGWVDGDYKSKTLSANYESDNMYYGTHIGAGHKLKIDCSKALTSYAQLILTHQKGDTVHPVVTEKLKIDDSNSVRTRLGLRYTQDIKSGFTAYTGAAWDYEHDGKQKGKLNTGGVISSVDSPDIKGSTGMFELGGNWDIRETAWTLDTSIRGYVGKREGVSGNIQVRYRF